MKNEPVFIVGNRRSGTTMLRLMVASHPNIGIPPEGGFVVTMGWRWAKKQLVPADYSKLVEEFFLEDNAQDWDLSKHQLTWALESRMPCHFSEFVDEVYRQYMRVKFPGKKRWGDKTTWYLDYIPFLAKLLPGAKFVHIIRDGRSVVASFKKVGHLTSDVVESALEWDWSLNRIRNSCLRFAKDRYYELTYESLVVNPTKELEDLCRFIEEPFSSEMLDFYKFNRDRKLEPERHMGWKGMTKKPANSNRVDSWKSELKAEELEKFWSIAGNTMKRFGYEAIVPDISIVGLIEKKKRISWYKSKRMLRQFIKPKIEFLKHNFEK